MSNFLPNIKCPHCNANLVTSISGFGSELNFREKEYYKCHKSYFLQIHVSTTIKKSVNDGIIRSIQDRIKFLKKQRKKTLGQLYLELKEAQKIVKETDIMAAQMHKNRKAN